MTEEKRGIRFAAAIAVCVVAIGGVLVACEMAELSGTEKQAAGLAGLSQRPAHVEMLRSAGSVGRSSGDSIELPALAPPRSSGSSRLPAPPLTIRRGSRKPRETSTPARDRERCSRP